MMIDTNKTEETNISEHNLNASIVANLLPIHLKTAEINCLFVVVGVVSTGLRPPHYRICVSSGPNKSKQVA